MVQLMPLPPIISCFIKTHIGLIFLVPAYAGCPGNDAIKRVSVSLSVPCDWMTSTCSVCFTNWFLWVWW